MFCKEHLQKFITVTYTIIVKKTPLFILPLLQSVVASAYSVPIAWRKNGGTITRQQYKFFIRTTGIAILFLQGCFFIFHFFQCFFNGSIIIVQYLVITGIAPPESGEK